MFTVLSKKKKNEDKYNVHVHERDTISNFARHMHKLR